MIMSGQALGAGDRRAGQGSDVYVHRSVGAELRSMVDRVHPPSGFLSFRFPGPEPLRSKLSFSYRKVMSKALTHSPKSQKLKSRHER